MVKYLRPMEALADIRVLRALTEPVADVKKRATRLVSMLRRTLPEWFDIKLVTGVSMAGGGSLPTREIPTILVGLRGADLSAAALEERLRWRELPIIVRVADDQVLLDVRTLDPEEFAEIRDALKAILAEGRTGA